MPSEWGLPPDDRDREDAPEIMECWALEEILHVIFIFLKNFIFNKEDSFSIHINNWKRLRISPTLPLERLKRVMGDTWKRIHLHLFLGQPERVMERMQWEKPLG
jgi:hypothetical protein